MGLVSVEQKLPPEVEFYQELGDRIRRAREARGWTQLRLGMELGLSRVLDEEAAR